MMLFSLNKQPDQQKVQTSTLPVTLTDNWLTLA